VKQKRKGREAPQERYEENGWERRVSTERTNKPGRSHADQADIYLPQNDGSQTRGHVETLNISKMNSTRAGQAGHLRVPFNTH
jgi:hypothetical protein